MSKPKLEIAHVIEQFGHELVAKHKPNTWTLRTLNTLRICRTAALGGHKELCDCCGKTRISYNSCRNRHCPKCHASKQAFWFSTLSLFSFIIFHLSFVLAQTSKMSVEGKSKKSSSEFVSARDDNGRFCAAIKVISDMDGFKYQSNNGVVKVDDMPGRDMVYLSPDERVLEIYHSGYEMFRMILSEYGIQLHPKEVWVVRIKGAPKTGDLLPVTIFVNALVVLKQNSEIIRNWKGMNYIKDLPVGKYELNCSALLFPLKTDNATNLI